MLDDNEKPWVVYFSATNGIGRDSHCDVHLKAIMALDQVYDYLKERITLKVKLHPYENMFYYDKYFKNKNNVEFISDEDSLKVLKQMSYKNGIYLGIYSTTILEAMLFRIPVIQLSMSKYKLMDKSEDYSLSGCGFTAYSPNELIFYIEKILDYNYDYELMCMNQMKKTGQLLGGCIKKQCYDPDILRDKYVQC